MTYVGERMKLLNCVSPDMEELAKMLASAPRAVSKYRANVPDHLSGHCKMAARSGLGTRLDYRNNSLAHQNGYFNTPDSLVTCPALYGLDCHRRCVPSLSRPYATWSIGSILNRLV